MYQRSEEVRMCYPAVSQLDKRSLINTYDVTDYIHSGTNNLIFVSRVVRYLKPLWSHGNGGKGSTGKFPGRKLKRHWLLMIDGLRETVSTGGSVTGDRDVMAGWYCNEKAQNVALTNPMR